MLFEATRIRPAGVNLVPCQSVLTRKDEENTIHIRTKVPHPSFAETLLDITLQAEVHGFKRVQKHHRSARFIGSLRKMFGKILVESRDESGIDVLGGFHTQLQRIV